MSTCAHCGHSRLPEEAQPANHCPACGIEYGQQVDLHAYQIDDRPKPAGNPRGLLIGGGILFALCLLAFLAFTQRDRPWDEAGAAKPVAPPPKVAGKPAAPAVVARMEEPSEEEQRLAHERWLSMAFAERAGKEFQRFADSPLDQLGDRSLDQLGDRSDALFALKRDWEEMILSNPCIAAAKPILGSALAQASDAVTAKRIGDPGHAAITIAATEEHARFIQAVQACKKPGTTAQVPTEATPPPTASAPAPAGTSPPQSVPQTGRMAPMQEHRSILPFSERWQTEMNGLLALMTSPEPPMDRVAARGKALMTLQQEWKQLELKSPCLVEIKPLYDDSINRALLAITTFLQGKPEHVVHMESSATLMARFLKEARACTSTAPR